MENTTTGFTSTDYTVTPSTSWYTGPSVLDQLEQEFRTLKSLLEIYDERISDFVKLAIYNKLVSHYGDLLAVPTEHQEALADANRFFNRESR